MVFSSSVGSNVALNIDGCDCQHLQQLLCEFLGLHDKIQPAQLIENKAREVDMARRIVATI